MNHEDLGNVVNIFKEDEWNYDKVNKIGTYKNDFSLQVKLLNERSRKDDELLILQEWDDFFKKYPNSRLVSITFFYDNAEVYVRTTLIYNKIIIPLPVAANMINEFYENEINIARMFSDDESSFSKFVSKIKQRNKNY